MNETLNLLAKRYTCRDYSERIPETKDLEAIAQAALQAPSAYNGQPWHIVLIHQKDLIEQMNSESLEIIKEVPAYQDFYKRIQERGGAVFYHAPSMVLVLKKTENTEDKVVSMDAGIVTGNVALAATSLGLSTTICASGGIVFQSEKAQEWEQKLKFPKGYTFGIAILIGYAKNDNGKPHELDQSKVTWIR
ncbi:nitroreductase [Clostridia bacterium]|nr:nitroreductase [Clostridia bacterium]